MVVRASIQLNSFCTNLPLQYSAEEAGQYLATYKRFEHKPPNMIKERIEKEPGAIMRAALTGISKVNKTDVETLRTTFGVRSRAAAPNFAYPFD